MTRGFVSALIVLVVAAMPASVRAQGADLEQAATALAGRIAAAGGTTVAVADFTDLQGRVTELGRFFAEELSISLVNAGQGLKVIDRGHIRTLLREHKLAGSGVIDPDTAAELGRIAGVGVLVTGSVTESSDSAVRLTLKALDTKTAAILAATATTTPRTAAMTGLLRRDVVGETGGSGPAASPRPVGAPNVRPFQNAFLIATVAAVAFSEERSYSYVSLTIELENKTSGDLRLVFARSDADLSDDRAGNWSLEQVSGISTVPFSSGSPPDENDYTTFSPGGRQPVVIRFRSRSAFSRNGRPSMINLAMNGFRRRGDTNERLSIGITGISLGQ